MRKENDCLGDIEIPEDKIWGTQTQRAIQYFHIGTEFMPKELIATYGIIKKSAAHANYHLKKLDKHLYELISQACDELINHQLDEMFPLHVWISGSGVQFNMNINEVIANRCCQITKHPLGSKTPVHPNDHVNMSQSSNDTFPTAMHVASALFTTHHLIPSVESLITLLESKAKQWQGIVKVGRTHMQDAVPITLGQEFSGFSAMLKHDLKRINVALQDLFSLTLGGTAVGTCLNASEEFARHAIEQISIHTKLPFVPVDNRFAAQGSHDAIVHFSASLKTLANSLLKIGNDVRLLACGPHGGIAELILPHNEPGSSIMPGKVNPTQIESLTMVCYQVMANDFAVTLGGSGGCLQMNAYKPLMIHNVLQSLRLLTDSCMHFGKFAIENLEPNTSNIEHYLSQCMMLATSLTPKIGYDNVCKIVFYANEHDLSLKEAAIQLKLLSSEEFDSLVDPKKMTLF